MRARSTLLVTTIGFVLTATTVLATEVADTWRSKVDPWVLTKAAEGPTEALVVLAEQADLPLASRMVGKPARGRYVVARLRATAARSQGPLLASLAEAGVEHRPYWIVNMVWARIGTRELATIAARGDVSRIIANPRVSFEAIPDTPRAPEGACPPIGTEASLLHLGADDFWDQGFDGNGVVVAGHDTGYEWDHPALRDAYRGFDGATTDHDYNWHDAIHAGGGACGADSAVPCDDNNHGTHTMGTMVGDTGTNRIGMAPGARWIGCRNMDRGNGTPASYSECFEWFLAPTDVAGQNPDPDRAPDVINNSWICPPVEGCTDPTVMQAVVENARAAGIVVVASAGNSGSSCSSIDAPPAIYDAAFTVGASDLSDGIAFFSSRGPVTVDGSDRPKPDVTAPGVGICSSVRGGGYSSFSGTSMAGPHVAGLVALVLSAQPCLRGDPDAVEAFIRSGVVPRTTTQTCGGIPGSSVPNNTYGDGVVRAIVPTGAACGTLFVDGFESGDAGAWAAVVD